MRTNLRIHAYWQRQLCFYRADVTTKLPLPLYLSAVTAGGFPSPASDYMEKRLDFNEEYIKHPAATFYVSVVGDSMSGDGIFSGDRVLVDRAEMPTEDRILVCVLNDGYTVKRVQRRNGKTYLVSSNPSYPPREITEGDRFEVWGVVTTVVRTV